METTISPTEQSFSSLQTASEAVRKAAMAVVAESRRARNAAASGNLKIMKTTAGNLRAARQNLDRTGEALAEAVEVCQKTVDARRSGYLEEVRQHIVSDGCEALLHEGQLLCYPSIVRVTDSDRVTIDGQTWRSIRPSALTAELLKRQKRPPAFKSRLFLEALHKVYRCIVGRDSQHASASAPIVSLADIYELITALPGAQHDYRRTDFARDLYRLEESETLTTRKGSRAVLLGGSTRTKDRSQRLTFVAPGGREVIYSGIRFGDPT